MEARTYVSAYLERMYLAAHPELTAAARELVHKDIPQRMEKYANSAHEQALVAYAHTHEHLMQRLRAIEDVPDDEEFDRKRAQLFDETRLALFKIAETDRMCIDANLVGLLLSNISIDACLGELMKLERRVHEQLVSNVAGFSDNAPHFWDERFVAERTREGADPITTTAVLTVEEPTLVGWLHTLEALAQMCLASARYRAAERYARLVLRASGYPSHAEGTVFLALARLENEEGFFAFAHELEAERGESACPHAPALQARSPQARAQSAPRVCRAMRRGSVLPAQPHLHGAVPARATATARSVGPLSPSSMGRRRHHRRHARLHSLGGVR